jgi:hypothetical protein
MMRSSRALYEPREAFRADAPPGLFYSRHGDWFHDGDWVGHAGLSALLCRSVARAEPSLEAPEGALIVTTGRDVLPFLSEDAPLHAHEVLIDELGLTLALSHGREARVTWLALGPDHRFRAAVEEGRFWALLSRSATHAIEPHLDLDDAGHAFVTVGDARHPIVVVDADWSRPAPMCPPGSARGRGSR